MTAVTLEIVLAQARRLPLPEQARLTTILERERALRLIEMLDEWAADDSGYEDETWPQLQFALDEERRLIGMGSLFNGPDHSA